MGRQTRQLVWRLAVLMAEHKIKTTVDLTRRLKEVGVIISPSQLGRIVYDMPRRISTELLEGLINVFECEMGDLFRLEQGASKQAGAVRHKKRS